MSPLLLLLAVPLLLSRRKSGYSGGADMGSVNDPGDNADLSLPVVAAWVDTIVQSFSWRYYWGGFSRSVPAGGVALVDCSGGATLLLILLGILPATAARFTSSSLPSDARFVKVSPAEARPGDVVLYKGHVVVVVGGAGEGATIWSVSGGGQKTQGNDPNARPKLFAGLRYRSDLLGVYRVKSG